MSFDKLIDKILMPMLGLGLLLLVLLGVIAGTVGLFGCGILGADIPMCSN